MDISELLRRCGAESLTPVLVCLSNPAGGSDFRAAASARGVFQVLQSFAPSFEQAYDVPWKHVSGALVRSPQFGQASIMGSK